jgi:lipid-A-disaccharide synthase
MDCWWDASELSVMGLAEVVAHLPRLLGLRRQLLNRLLSHKPDVFIGIDAPDFNLRIEKKLKATGIPTIHYVSPTVWAWRPGRVKSIAKATHRVMCLFPFEPPYYREQPITADYTGHPLADDIPLQIGTESARGALGLEKHSHYVALLPGSRMSEFEKLSASMLDAAVIIQKRYPDCCFLVPAANELIRNGFTTLLSQYPSINCRVFSAQSREVMAAADVVVCASGTATLEVMLVNRPMVVCYRFAGTTYYLAKWLNLVKLKYFALPNIIASEALVPELLQDAVTGENISEQVFRWLEQTEARQNLSQRFEQIHRQLRIDAASTAAAAVLRHISVADETV